MNGSAIPLQPRLLVAARSLVGLTQSALATAAELPVSVISRYEAGTTTPRPESMNAIVAVLHSKGVRFVLRTPEVSMGVVLLVEDPQTSGRSGKRTPLFLEGR